MAAAADATIPRVASARVTDVAAVYVTVLAKFVYVVNVVALLV